MGHIDLASPVLHVWYKNSVSGGVHQLLGLSGNEIDKILAFVKYVVVHEVTDESREKMMAMLDKLSINKLAQLDEMYKKEQEVLEPKMKKELDKKYEDNKTNLHKEISRVKSIIADLHFGSTVGEADYRNIFEQYHDLVPFMSGSQAIAHMLADMDVEKEIKKQLVLFPTIKSSEQRKKAFALIKLLINLHVSGIRPEHMIIKKLPVIPPDLRPVVQLDGGRFASSDVNLFYRRVLMRNVRLKKMIQVGMPEVVKKNEIRLLQESVNNLLVGEKAGAAGGAGVKVFKSLSDMLSGKEGLFRKNLLGKRVDYSGRSVITVGPDLELDECGLPLYIAVRIFTPFIIGKLIEKQIVYTPKQAEKMIKDEDPIALGCLEEVIEGKYVLLNRAPTLHRLSIEAFKIRLMQGKTIRLHPLVCASFNADFDGDQMAVHLPLSDEAQREARELIAATKNILKPASGAPTITHSQDMVLGAYYLTSNHNDAVDLGIFNDLHMVLELLYAGDAQLADRVKLKWGNEYIDTTVGRCLFNSILPEKLQFLNKKVGKKEIKNILSGVFDIYGMEETVSVANAIKNMGFKYATKSATSINIFDVEVPVQKEEILKAGDEKANKIYTMYHRGFLSDEEKHELIINVWSNVKTEIEGLVKKSLAQGGDMYNMIDSGARGSYTHTTQIAGMKGLVQNPSGEIIELPIRSSFVEGLSPIEYFISAHSGRKGKADTALKTAESGYLTRKLCDSSQEVIIREEDCETPNYMIFSKDESELRGKNFLEMIYGRVTAEDIKDDRGNVVIERNALLNKENVELIANLNIEMLKLRSSLTCDTVSGVCQKCFGMDLATRETVAIGVPVGIIASQSIGEPATQLTMRTFHSGGVASKTGDMANGIERVKQLFEVRSPATPAIVAPFDGKISFYEIGKLRYMRVTSEAEKKTYAIKAGYEATVKKNELLVKGAVYASKNASKLKVKEEGIVLEVTKDFITLGVTRVIDRSLMGLSPLRTNDGDVVYKGEILTNGSLDIKEYKGIVGDLEAQKYIIHEVDKVYMGQGQDVNDKHMEVIVKQMFSKVFIEDSGDSSLVPGTHIKFEEFKKINRQLLAEGKKVAAGQRLALGLTSIAKETDSWLSAASFQETIRVMVGASLKGAIDELSDLKSNVIIGRLLPLGNEFVKRYIDHSDVDVAEEME